MNELGMLRRRRDDGLGPNSDIGNKLRALYGAVQQEEIPTRLIDLLEQLDAVEKQAKTEKSE
ncbi:NepR family anti-sigma factor [Devosia sp.]|uniref:NepR family anti-sigma factor n=1 Tax=Devosia sp. TaxID=1871048 RepID=UPI0025BF1222|nr:NepR family anti-sigma factor [Devosia sp.]